MKLSSIMPGLILGLCMALAACSTSSSKKSPPKVDLPDNFKSDQWEASQYLQGPLSIHQGPTVDDMSVVTLLFPQAQTAKMWIKIPGQREPLIARSIREYPWPGSDWKLMHFVFDGLKAGVTYQLEVISSAGERLDTRELQTLDGDSRRQLKFAAASCMDDFYIDEQREMWRQVADQDPDVLFLIGDNVYADRDINFYSGPAPADVIWKRFVETRLNLELYQLPRLIPTLAIWDDHDYGKNNGDRDFPDREQAKKIFEIFFPRIDNSDEFKIGPGVSYAWRSFGQQFVFMDDRSFRTADNSGGKLPAAEERHWGDEQTQFLLDQLRSAKGPTWIINGDQIFGRYHPFESFEGNHPNRLKEIMRLIRETNSSALAILTGDRHLFEVMKIPADRLGIETFEITTSPIHAKTFPGKLPIYNPIRMDGAFVDDSFNYALIASEAKGRQLDFKLRVYGPGRKLLYFNRHQVAPPATR